ncbi:MAG: hypothetical protein IBX56_12555 [Methylomicrobium sp.]|nr:hypothetical protein [Methylomicrobium sp.]
MSENLSNDAVIYAMLSINSEIAIQKDYLDSPELPADEREYEEETLADLEQALMEFIELYKNRLKADKTLPSLDELLYSEL